MSELPKLPSPQPDKKIKVRAYDIATQDNITGKGAFTLCKDFAEDLKRRLNANGYEANIKVKDNGYGGRHAYVQFRDENNNLWETHSLAKTPKKISA